ncbi:hypothetical protein ACEPAG_4684 [Sanghuangporus baumii]
MIPHKFPLDIFFELLKAFESKDIYNYFRCMGVSNAHQAMKLISSDKQDWVYLYNAIIKSRSLPMPTNLKNLDEAKTQDIISWFLHSISLNFNYTSERMQLSVCNVAIKPGLRVTWLKLMCARWCLIAAADYEESELSLWEISSYQQTRMVARVYLDAPVMDGEIDYCDGGAKCAVTVGATKPYILVLGLSQYPECVSLRQLAHLRKASHITFFEGDLLGFAARDGDDTYPYFANWKTGNSHCLVFPHSTPDINCPLPIEPCKAMTTKNGFIFTLHIYAIHVFSICEEDAYHPKHLAMLPLSEPVAHGRFLENVIMPNNTLYPTFTIRLLYYDVYTQIQQVTISINPKAHSTEMFSLEQLAFEEIVDDADLHLCYIGEQGRSFFCSTSSDNYREKPLVLLASRKAPDDAGMTTCLEVDYTFINDENIPPLRLISCLDFDDGIGLLLISSTSGDVVLASVLSEPIITSTSRQSSLGEEEKVEDSPSKIHQVPVSLDLPLFYAIRQKYQIHEELPVEITHLVITEWADARLERVEIDGWSNDWTRFSRLWDWIPPISRWGPLDRDFLHKTENVVFRNRLQTVGEMIPVLYRVENHREVVFRIGKRLFYLRTRRRGDHPDDFNTDPMRHIGVLPISYERLLTHPMEVTAALRTVVARRNLDEWEEPEGFFRQVQLAAYAYGVIH